MKQIAFAEVKDHLSKYLIEAGQEQIVITKHGKPAGVLTGFASEDDWFDFRLENDPRFVRTIAKARASVRDGQGVSWEQVKKEDDQRTACTLRRVPRRKCGGALDRRKG